MPFPQRELSLSPSTLALLGSAQNNRNQSAADKDLKDDLRLFPVFCEKLCHDKTQSTRMDVVVLRMPKMYSLSLLKPLTAAVTVVLLSLSSPTQASDLCSSVENTADFSAYQGQTIAEVRFIRNDVFDLEQPNTYWFHRFANRTHKITTEATLKEDVLFKAGDVLDADSLAET